MKRIAVLTEFFSQLTYEALPGEVTEKAGLVIADQVGVTLAGVGVEVSVATREFARRMFASGPCLVFGEYAGLSPAGASLCNAVAGSALDLDEGHNLVLGHPASVVFPAAFAAAEDAGSSMREFITAFVVGYETASRVSCSRLDDSGFATGVWGAYGAAAAASRLFAPSRQLMERAIGIAGMHGPRRPPCLD